MASPNVIPMADIMLVLLIIFMVITPMLQKGVTVDMARAQNAHDMQAADKDDAVIIAITRDGKTFLGNREVGLDEITLESLGELARMKPTGQGNPPVQFYARGLAHQRPLQRIGANKQHVKMWVTDGAGTLEAVWWNGGDKSLPVGKFDLAFAPQINEFKGNRTVQLKVLDWQPGKSP